MKKRMTTKELHEKLLQMSDLHSEPEIDGETLIWNLYNNASVYVRCDSIDGYIEVVGTAPFEFFIHWHPETDDNLLDDLYALGKKGNILVLSKLLTIMSTVYYGEANGYRFDKNKKWHWGRLIYLEQK